MTSSFGHNLQFSACNCKASPTLFVNVTLKPSDKIWKKARTWCLLILLLICSELPNYDKIVPTLLEYGLKELPNRCKITPGKYQKGLCLKVLLFELKLYLFDIRTFEKQVHFQIFDRNRCLRSLTSVWTVKVTFQCLLKALTYEFHLPPSFVFMFYI